jgi:UDP-glucose:(heptosyl)LPS alpha-1,3-glucosyltransferase
MSTKVEGVNRLKIAVLNRSFVSTGGGAERYSIALVEQLANRHDVHVFAQQIEHAWPGVTYHRLWTPFSKPRWINQLWFAVTSWWFTHTGFDVVHSHENTWHGQVQTVHVLPVKYSLFQGRGGVQLVFRWLKVMTSPRLLAYLCLEFGRYKPHANRHILVTSPTLASIMANTYPRTVPMLKVLAPGVSRVSGIANRQDKLAARKDLGLPSEGHCVLFVANDYEKKGLNALLRAMQLLPAEVYLSVIGNAAHIAAFKRNAQEFGLMSRVFFLGPQRDMDVAYRAADCLAHPTLEDTFAMVVLEALSHGVVVVVSKANYCGISALLDNGQQALILENPLDANEIAGLLQKSLKDELLHHRLVQNGLKFAHSYLWSEIASRQENIYARVVAVTNRYKSL